MIIIAAEACFVASKDDIYIPLWVGSILDIHSCVQVFFLSTL